MTNQEAKEKIFYQWQDFLEHNIDYAGISEAYKMAIKALEQGDILREIRKRISDLYNTDVTYDNGDYNTMDTPTLDKVLEYFDSEVNT